MVAPVVRDRRQVGKKSVDRGKKSFMYILGARTANRHR